ncbi:hypothetical protein CCUG62472_01064 [Mycobacteroides salmoniphilum]|nr:hypothetical protein CCUG62472_01064 [Mycobacteroides salmoniphilum]
MINTVLGWGTAAPYWSEVMKLLFWVSLAVFSLVSTLLPRDITAGSTWVDPDHVDLPLPYSVDQSGSLLSTVDIEGARFKSDVLRDVAPGFGGPLMLGRSQASPMISPIVIDRVHFLTASAGMYIPSEHELSVADWDSEGGKKLGPEDMTFRLRIRESAHMGIAGGTWPIARDVAQGGAPMTIATISAQAINAIGAAVPVTAEIFSDFRFRQLNLRLRVIRPDMFDFPIAIRLSCRAGE